MEVQAETDIRKLALQYLTPDGPRKVVRKPKTEATESHWQIPHDGGHLSVRSWGEGLPVLLVHGWAANQTDMFKYVSAFVANGFTAIALDLPAHGESSGETASLDQLADGIIAVAKHSGDFYAVVAHSIGCAAAQVAMSRGLKVEKAVMLSSPVNYGLAARGYAQRAGLNDSEIAKFLQELHSMGVRTAIKSLDVVQNFQTPALIIHSEDDLIIPITTSRSIAETWSGSRLLTVDKLGHRGLLKDDDVVTAVVDFVRA